MGQETEKRRTSQQVKDTQHRVKLDVSIDLPVPLKRFQTTKVLSKFGETEGVGSVLQLTFAES